MRFAFFVLILLTLVSCGFSLTSDEDIDAFARMKSALSIASHTKQSVSDHYLSLGRWPDQALQTKLRMYHDELTNPFTVSVSDNGVIRITFGTGYTLHPLRNRSLTFVPEGTVRSVEWACVNIDVPSKYLPEHCQGADG